MGNSRPPRQNDFVASVLGNEYRLPPSEITSRALPSGIFGYRRTAVDALRHECASALEHARDEIRRLHAALTAEQEANEECRQLELQLKAALAASKHAADTALDTARREADAILQEAKARAAAMPDELRAEIAALNAQRVSLRQSMLSILDAHHALLAGDEDIGARAANTEAQAASNAADSGFCWPANKDEPPPLDDAHTMQADVPPFGETGESLPSMVFPGGVAPTEEAAENESIPLEDKRL